MDKYTQNKSIEEVIDISLDVLNHNETQRVKLIRYLEKKNELNKLIISNNIYCQNYKILRKESGTAETLLFVLLFIVIIILVKVIRRV